MQIICLRSTELSPTEFHISMFIVDDEHHAMPEQSVAANNSLHLNLGQVLIRPNWKAATAYMCKLNRCHVVVLPLCLVAPEYPRKTESMCAPSTGKLSEFTCNSKVGSLVSVILLKPATSISFSRALSLRLSEHFRGWTIDEWI